MKRRILTTLDGSAASEAVLPYLETLLRSQDAEVTLAHVVTRESSGDDEIRTYLDGIVSGLEAKGAIVNSRVLKGDPAAEIVREAVNGGYALITLCTRGRSGLKRLLMGSVAQAILRRSPIPVLIVHPVEAGAAPPKVRRIVVPLDGTHASASILPAVGDLARAMQARVGFVSVVSPTKKETMPVEVVAENIFREQKELQKLGLEVELAILYGDPATETVGFAERNRADLVAIATHGRKGLDRLLHGSVAEKILRTTRIPLLVVKPTTKPSRPVRTGVGVHAGRSVKSLLTAVRRPAPAE